MIEVQEHRPSTRSYLAMKKELKAYNRTHPKVSDSWPSGWWILPGLFVAVLVLIVVIAIA